MPLDQENVKQNHGSLSTNLATLNEALLKSAKGLTRNDKTVIDHSLVDMEEMLTEANVVDKIDLVETRRGEVNDITCTIHVGSCYLHFKVIATMRFFAIRDVMVKDTLSDTTYHAIWYSKRPDFKMDIPSVEESVHCFLTAMTEVL